MTLPTNEKAVSQSGAAFLWYDGALLSYDRNFGSIGNAGVVKVQRRILDSHAFQGFATGEGILSNSLDAVWNRDAFQGYAPREGFLADALDTARNRDAYQGFATGEGSLADARDWFAAKFRWNA